MPYSTRAVTGTLTTPAGTGITTGSVKAVPIGIMPASSGSGMLTPVETTFTITSGAITGTLVVPARYQFSIYNGSERVLTFHANVAEGAATTIQDIYLAAEGEITVSASAIYEGSLITLLSSGTVSAGEVLTADGSGGLAFAAAATGDMTKAVYDTNDDGVVGAADAAPWAGITGKPATFPPDTHAHAAADVTSGQLGAARGGTGQDSSAWTGVPKVAAGTWSAGAAAADVDAIPTDAGIVAVNGARDLTSTDAGKILECNGTFTLTAPNGLDAGFQVTVINVGAGTITLAATTTLQSKGAKTKVSSQYGAATLYHRGSNVWLAVGDLST